MNLSIGLVGLPRSGKTTVFNALTRSSARVGAGGAQGANVAVVPVPDGRLEFLTAIFHPKKVTPATKKKPADANTGQNAGANSGAKGNP